MIITRSHRQRITARSWETKIAEVWLSRQMSASRCRICAWEDTSSALVISSQSRISGSTAIARAIAMRWHCPPLSWRGVRSISSRCNPTRSASEARSSGALLPRRLRTDSVIESAIVRRGWKEAGAF